MAISQISNKQMQIINFLAKKIFLKAKKTNPIPFKRIIQVYLSQEVHNTARFQIQSKLQALAYLIKQLIIFSFSIIQNFKKSQVKFHTTS